MRRILSRVYRGETNIDFIGRRRWWFALSGLLLAVSVASVVTKGLNFGIQFRGGLQIKAPVAEDGPLADASDDEVNARVRDALAPVGASDAQIQTVSAAGGARSVLVQTEATGARAERVKAAVSKTVGAPITDSSEIGEKWGQEITAKAVRALLFFLVVVVAFISWRFEWKMALGAIVALFHDVVITIGVYSLVGFEVTPSTVIALLTILGYSLYDTVVVFDKVEESTDMFATTGKMTYQDSANLAMNQVFMRSLNTSLSTLLPVAALLFVGAGLLGAETLKDLALALFVGILTGAYSSIFVATPVVSMLKEREPRYRSVREKVLKEARRAALRPVPAGAPVEVSQPAATTASAAPRPSRTQTKTRPRSKKVKRRRKR